MSFPLQQREPGVDNRCPELLEVSRDVAGGLSPLGKGKRQNWKLRKWFQNLNRERPL